MLVSLVAAELDVPVFDLAGAIPDEPRYFIDPIHFTAAGNRARASLLADFLVEQGLVGRRGAQSAHRARGGPTETSGASRDYDPPADRRPGAWARRRGSRS